MTTSENKENRPDVESIIQKIREDIQGDSPGDLPLDGKNGMTEEDLYGNLNAANKNCVVGQIRKSGLKGMVLRCLYKPFAVLIGEINQLNASVIRVLNKLVRILEGEETSSELMANHKRRISMLEKLSRRLDAYDDLKMEERLKKLEDLLAQTQSKEKN